MGAGILPLLAWGAAVVAVPPPPAAAAVVSPPRAAASATSPSVFSGRGVYYFDGRVRCPFAGVGRRGDRASNRIALDDDQTHVSIDREGGRIVVDSRRVYPQKAIIADFTFLGTAANATGGRIPLAVHVKLEKKKARVSVDLHPHWTERVALHDPQIEPFEIAVTDGGGERVVVTRADILRVATETKILYTVAGSLLEVKDNLHSEGPSSGDGEVLADVSLGFGSAHINKMLIRAELRALPDLRKSKPATPIATAPGARTLADRLNENAWQLRLTALSSLLSPDTLRRDLFMLGLDRLPVVADRSRQGLGKGESITFTVRDGAGRVAWGTAEQELPAPLDVARAFLEFNFLGAVLARQVAQNAQNAQPAPATPPSPQTR